MSISIAQASTGVLIILWVMVASDLSENAIDLGHRTPSTMSLWRIPNAKSAKSSRNKQSTEWTQYTTRDEWMILFAN